MIIIYLVWVNCVLIRMFVDPGLASALALLTSGVVGPGGGVGAGLAHHPLDVQGHRGERQIVTQTISCSLQGCNSSYFFRSSGFFISPV